MQKEGTIQGIKDVKVFDTKMARENNSDVVLLSVHKVELRIICMRRKFTNKPTILDGTQLILITN